MDQWARHPAPAVGGLLLTALAMLARDRMANVQLDTAALSTLSVPFLTSIGRGARLSLLRRGGSQVAIFFAFVTAFCLVLTPSASGWRAGSERIRC